MIEAELIERLQRLERANRRLWFVAVGALVLLTAAIGLRAVYAAPAIPQKIVAHELDIVDSSGKTAISIRGRMIDVLDAESGLPRIAIGNNSPKTSGVWLFEGHGSKQIQLVPSESGVVLFDTQGRPRLAMSLQNGPRIRFDDAKGFDMDLGTTNTITPTTGQTQQTSAASIVMFGNDKNHHVIWRAPQ